MVERRGVEPRSSAFQADACNRTCSRSVPRAGLEPAQSRVKTEYPSSWASVVDGGGCGGIRTHMALGNGFTDRRTYLWYLTPKRDNETAVIVCCCPTTRLTPSIPGVDESNVRSQITM